MSLSYQDRMKLLVKESEKTMNDLCKNLDEFGRCLCVRPTGFGKTYLLVHLAYKYIQKYPNKRVLYVTPNDIIETEIRNNDEYDQNIIDKYFDFITYQALSLSVGAYGNKKSLDRHINMLDNCSICLLDEVHKAPAEGYVNFYNYTSDYYSVDKVHLVGVTATPLRKNEEETRWMYECLFEGHQTYEYTLYNAISSGLLLEPIYCMAKFGAARLIADFKDEVRRSHLKANGYFNEEAFDTSFNKAYRENGKESEIIYQNIKKAGYNLLSDNPDDSYIKFIVFFKNTKNLVEVGEQVENWFFDAVEKEASKDFGVDIEYDKHVDYVISSTADEHSGYVIKEHTDKKDFRSCIYDASEVGRNDRFVGHRIDLVFNVNIITVGYHVSHISGVMMIRGTGTDILYYQQLGRCFSVRAFKPSIVFDLAYNKKTQINRDRKRLFEKNVFSGQKAGVTTLIERLPSEKVSDKEPEEVVATGFEEGFDDLLEKWKDPNYSYVSKILYLYVDRHMPISLIAQNTGLSCHKVTQYLIDSGVKLQFETPMFEYLNEDDKLSDTSSNEFRLLRFLYSKKAYTMFMGAKQGAKRGVSNLFMLVIKLLGR